MIVFKGLLFTPLLAALFNITSAHAVSAIVTEISETGGNGITFEKLPSAATDDAATNATFSLVDGTRDPNGGDLAVLHDGRLPQTLDQPAANFFFRAGTDGGRIAVDLGKTIAVKRIGTYSWHGGTRGPQVYTLFAADGEAKNFDATPKRDADPEKSGWTKLADVDTRPKTGDGGGRHGVSVSEKDGNLGLFRYLLFDLRRTEDRDPFGNTFFSEIDVIDSAAPEPTPISPPKTVGTKFATEDGTYRFTLDATEAPDLLEWAEKELKPVILEWYPKIVAMLPSEGFKARTEVHLRFRNDMGGVPASAGGGIVNMSAPWFARELQREARGSVVHELVHVVQEYGRGLRGRRAAPVPGWITEGVPDYIRWFLYEPQTRGAEIGRRNLESARFDASYRVSANFLDWVVRAHDKEFIRKLNTAAREGRYSAELWKELTGKTVEELGDDWKMARRKELDAK
jgi:hypothetical protein